MTINNCLAPAAVALTTRYPFWSEIYYSMTVVETTDETECSTAGTDGRMLVVNTTWWKTLSKVHAVSVLVHEICHKIFFHCTRRGTRDARLWNVAADYAVNGILRDNGFGLPLPHLYDAKYAGMTAEAIYAELLKEQKAADPSDGSEWATDSSGKPMPGVPKEWMEDIRQMAGTPEEIEAAEMAIKALVERAVANARTSGSLPAGIAGALQLAHRAAGEPWYNRLHRYMQSLSSSAYNWARQNRRTLKSHGYFSPMHHSESLGEIAIFIDTSGSCWSAAEQASFAGHMNAILSEARPRRIHLYYFDAAVYDGGVIEAGELDVVTRPQGGGGTNFVPIFERIEEDGNPVELVIVLSDLFGGFPSVSPDYPVVWACTSKEVAPFGETIYIS